MLKPARVEEFLPQGTKLSRAELTEIIRGRLDIKTLRVTTNR